MSTPDAEATTWILHWTTHLEPPYLVNKSAYGSCRNCARKFGFTQSKARYCRLCGHMFCASCVCKQQIPDRFHSGAGKAGLSHVCFDCFGGCLEERQLEAHDALTPRRLPFRATQHPEHPRRVLIHPPSHHISRHEFASCGLCGSEKLARINVHCAACGDVFCEDCLTNDTEIPAAYASASQESTRLCRYCRFRVARGATLVSSPPPPDAVFVGLRGIDLDATADELAERSVSPTRGPRLFFQAQLSAFAPPRPSSSRRTGTGPRLVQRTKTQPRTSSKLHSDRPSIGFAVTDRETLDRRVRRSSSVSMLESSGSAATTLLPCTRVAVRWEHEELDYARVDVTPADTLQELYHKLTIARPEAKERWFSFLFQGVPIKSEMWSLIEARQLGGVVFLVEGVFDTYRRAEVGRMGQALFDFDMEEESMLPLLKSEYLVIFNEDPTKSWMYGFSPRLKVSGWFPNNRVQVLNEEPLPPRSNHRRIGTLPHILPT